MLADRAKKASLGFGGIVEPSEPAASVISGKPSVSGHSHSYSYAALRYGVRWPPDVNPQQREQHLCEEEFQQILGMNFPEFCSLPAWRQAEMKKERSLF
jgi:hypothetical protein